MRLAGIFAGLGVVATIDSKSYSLEAVITQSPDRLQSYLDFAYEARYIAVFLLIYALTFIIFYLPYKSRHLVDLERD